MNRPSDPPPERVITASHLPKIPGRPAVQAEPRDRDQQGVANPDVIVDFRLQGPALIVNVRNIGAGCGHQVRVQFRPTFRGGGGTLDIPSINLFSRLEFIAPGDVISGFVDVADHYFARKEPEVLDCIVTFKDDAGRGVTRRIRHDLGIFRDLPRHACRSGD